MSKVIIINIYCNQPSDISTWIIEFIFFILGIAGYDPRDGRPKLSAWLERVRNDMNPYYDEAHVMVNRLAQKYEAEEKQQAKI